MTANRNEAPMAQRQKLVYLISSCILEQEEM